MQKIKVMSVFGTRPEAIKMAPLVKELERREEIESYVCLTGQHREMLDSVMEIFDLKADFDLNIMEKRQTLGCIAAAICAPIVNTGVFAIGMLTVFKPILQDYAGGTNIVYFLFVAFIGVNFLVEFAVNAAMSAAIARIVQVVQKQLEK